MYPYGRVALRPHNEAPRRSWQTERGTVDYVISSGITDSTRLTRVQFLGRFGLTGNRADLVAALLFGERHEH